MQKVRYLFIYLFAYLFILVLFKYFDFFIELSVISWYKTGMVSRGLTALILFRIKRCPKIPTAFNPTPSILVPCLGQTKKYTLSCLTQFLIFERPVNVSVLR